MWGELFGPKTLRLIDIFLPVFPMSDISSAATSDAEDSNGPSASAPAPTLSLQATVPVLSLHLEGSI